MDQLRADVFIDLLCGTHMANGCDHNNTATRLGQNNGKGKGSVNITVDLETLLGLARKPGDLAGYGPVISDIACQITEQHPGQWQYTVTDPKTGLPVHNGVTKRRPTASQQRQVETANPTCVFPGCRMPSVESDLDHRIPWAKGGPTTTSNLAPLCRHDHCTRHQHGWAYRPLDNGDSLWTPKLGQTQTTSRRPP